MQCSQLIEQKSSKVTYRFEFGRQCQDCPVRSACVPSTQPHRTIVVGALHETLQQRRREQQSPEFKRLMQQRNGIEGTISELVRGHGLRRARYKGFVKVALQNQLVAAACNLKRWLQKLLKAAFCEGFEGAFSGLKALFGLQRVAPGIWSGLYHLYGHIGKIFWAFFEGFCHGGRWQGHDAPWTRVGKRSKCSSGLSANRPAGGASGS
jgi:hypothetical protein